MFLFHFPLFFGGRLCGASAICHYNDVIMTTMASQFTSLTVVYSTVYSDADQRKYQSSASLAFVWGIHRDRWIPRTKGQLRGKCFHLMTSSGLAWVTKNCRSNSLDFKWYETNGHIPDHSLFHKKMCTHALQWRHNERDDDSNHRRLDCLFNLLLRRRSKKTSKFRVTGLCDGEFYGDRWIPLTNRNANNYFDYVIMGKIPIISKSSLWVPSHMHLINFCPEQYEQLRLASICISLYKNSWWRPPMETFSALLDFCVENSPVTGEFPSQRPVSQSFDAFFDLCLSKPLSK